MGPADAVAATASSTMSAMRPRKVALRMGVKRIASFAPGDSRSLDPAPGLSMGP